MTTEPHLAEREPTLSAIVPRWEWRTFGEHFGAAESRLAALGAGRVQDSDETYVLSLESDVSAKVRDDLLDAKELQAVNGDGLEQWRPVLKAAFPLPARDVSSVLSLLGVDVPPLAREAYTFQQLIEEVVRPSGTLLAVGVHKHREHYTPGGCMAEVTELRTASGSTRTLAVESEDPALVIETVRDLGLGSRPNVCLARGLKTLVGFDAVRYGVIDVGTNSVKLHIGERRPDSSWRTIVDRAEITRLGEGLEESGRLGQQPIERTAEAITGMVDEARRNGAVAVAAVGTAGLRSAPNSAELVDRVRERSGVGIEVISGDEEARLAYLAATSALGVGRGTLVVFDTGGGSTQFTFGRAGKVEERFSVNVGAVRFTERFNLSGVVSETVLGDALDAIAADLAKLDGRPSPDALLGMGGTLTNIAAVKHELAAYDPDVVHGTVLDAAELDRQIELFRTHTLEERREIPGLQPRRAGVILAGACIVRSVLRKLGRESLTVSDRGLRHGLLVVRFGLADNAPRDVNADRKETIHGRR
jgi:exopolyphosphatase/guanosine-5'-triphosphate,3'-diphosphate pyrophosphatase